METDYQLDVKPGTNVVQVVDAVKGVHCMIAKQDFAAWF